MFDIFYCGQKPNRFAHERHANSVAEAQQLSRTRYFWWITYLADLDTWDFVWEPTPWQSNQRHAWASQHQKDAGVYLVPRDWNGTDTNYHRSPAITRLQDRHVWKIPPGEFGDFDYSWHPDPTDPPYIYQFGTQHQRTGGPQYAVNGATDIKFVDQLKIKTNRVATAVVEIDHLDGNAGNNPHATEQVRYFDNYRDTLIRIAKKYNGQHEFIWICSSICDYEGFDFSWHPEQWQATMLHVFASNEQKFGDTFYMHVPTFAYRAERAKLLDWYDVNFVQDIVVPRRPIPVIEHTMDSHADAVKVNDWAGPLALFTTNGLPMTIPAVPLWREETKTIVPLSRGASAVIVPKAAKGSVKTQLYDYPYINKKDNRRHSDQPLDIVFISNGEYGAEQHYKHLLDSTYNKNNIVCRIDGVNGRVAAYHAAANATTTPWFFAVFAKLQINQSFDWTWQPDRMQQPKHYIFHAKNPVNGLVYGHQAMIAYNRELVLNNPGVGLDFTLDSAHEVVPNMSGIAYYNQTPWMTWRTAFREVIKLRADLPDVEAEYRISQWLKPNHHHVDQYSHLGAEDAIEYYESVNGDPTELRKSYDWAWLASYAFVKRSLTPDQ